MRSLVFVSLILSVAHEARAAENKWLVQLDDHRTEYFLGEPINISASATNQTTTELITTTISHFFEYSTDGKIFKKYGFSKEDQELKRGTSLQRPAYIKVKPNKSYKFKNIIFTFSEVENQQFKSIRLFFDKPGKYWLRAGIVDGPNDNKFHYSKPVAIVIKKPIKKENREAFELFNDISILILANMNGREVGNKTLTSLVKPGLKKAENIIQKYANSIYAKILRSVNKQRVINLKELNRDKQKQTEKASPPPYTIVRTTWAALEKEGYNPASVIGSNPDLYNKEVETPLIRIFSSGPNPGSKEFHEAKAKLLEAFVRKHGKLERK